MSTLSRANKFVIVIAVLLICGFFVANGFKNTTRAIAAEAPPAMPVKVTVVEKMPVRIWNSFSGRLSAVDFVEIRPQVSGLVTSVKFNDGQTVNKGDVLYIIDPRVYKANLQQANADLEAAENVLAFAKKEHVRAQNLIKTKAISKRVYDERANEHLVAKAELESAKAKVARAKIDFDFAYVKAPVSGQVSRAEITQGNLVEAGPNAPVLTSIVSNQGIYADFDVDEKTYLKYVFSNGVELSDVQKSIPVRLILQEGKVAYDGTIHSFDNRIDASTGTIRARALFENKEQRLLPGMFATIEMGSAGEEKQILISERAIGVDQDRKFVYIVNDENKTAYREVSLGESVAGQRIVLSGLNEGDRVITEGLMRIRPDMPVVPTIVPVTNQQTAH